MSSYPNIWLEQTTVAHGKASMTAILPSCFVRAHSVDGAPEEDVALQVSGAPEAGGALREDGA